MMTVLKAQEGMTGKMILAMTPKKLQQVDRGQKQECPGERQFSLEVRVGPSPPQRH